MDVAGEGSDEDATLGVLDRMEDRRTDLRLGLGEARDGGVGGVGHEQVDALLAELCERTVVGGNTVDRGLIELEVARVHNSTSRSLQEHAERAGDGVRRGEKLDGEAAEIDVAATLDLAELGCTDAELGKLALDEAEGELAGENRHLVVEVLQEIRQRTRMVLMAMGDDDAAKLVLVLENVGVIRQDEVDAGLVVVGEHEACVDEHHVIAALEGGHVLADAVKAAQGDDLERHVRFLVVGCHRLMWLLSIAR